MKGNGVERDTLDGVIEALERTVAKWRNADNQTSFADFRDAIFYLQEYRDMLSRMIWNDDHWEIPGKRERRSEK